MRTVKVSMLDGYTYEFEDRPYIDKENVALWHEINIDGNTVSVVKHYAPETTRIVFATNAPCIVRES